MKTLLLLLITNACMSQVVYKSELTTIKFVDSKCIISHNDKVHEFNNNYIKKFFYEIEESILKVKKDSDMLVISRNFWALREYEDCDNVHIIDNKRDIIITISIKDIYYLIDRIP